MTDDRRGPLDFVRWPKRGEAAASSPVEAAHAQPASKVDLVTFDSMMRGLFPRTPAEMPDWARKAWADRAELVRTGRRVPVEPHEDNTGAPCREVGPASLVYDLEQHDCCYLCNEQADNIAHADRVEAGALPLCLAGADGQRYAGGDRLPSDWDGWCRMWRDVAWVRLQGFERDADAIHRNYTE